MDLYGNYSLEVLVGNNVIPVVPQMISDLSVILDIDRFVPMFNFTVKDVTGLLGEIIPFDNESNQITLRFSRQHSTDKLNEFKFVVKRRRPLGDKTYSIEGVLDVPNLFTPVKIRTLTGNVKTNLESIAVDELGISSEIGGSLNFDKTIIQPSWTNIFLLRYLRERLEGKGGTGCFYCFIKNVEGFRTLVFKSITELFLSDVGPNKFIIGNKPFEDFLPVSEWRIFDNSALYTSLLGSSENYNYFDYETGTYTSDSVALSNCPSLADYYLIDEDNDTAVESIRSLGCANSFTSDFKGEVRNSYYKNITGFIHMWISTWGVESLSPGDIVQVHFSDAFIQGDIAAYQHSGFWMVKRVVHILSSSYMSNILLTRCGIDTDMNTTLTKSLQARL
jgi:hypothetical protein